MAAISTSETSRRQSLGESLGLKTIVVFFSSKAARSGPRYLIQITVILIAGFILTRLLLPHRWSEALDYTHDVVDWVTGEEDMPSQYGGIRIVVFGAPDIATPPRIIGSKHEDIGLSWTEQMCEELECSEHLSFVPTSNGPVHSVASNDVYTTALGKLLDRTRGNPGPGMNYTFMQRQYNTPSNFADLRAQVNTFLAMEKPSVSPKETIYVVSFGMWEVWHLAGMPLEAGYEAVGDFSRHIFDQIEELFQEARNPDSIAFSSGPANSTVSSEPGTFRVVVPRLMDPSMAPGWKFRSTPPKPHNKAEHSKNAAYLAMRWNWEMNRQIQEWVQRDGVDTLEARQRSPSGDAAAASVTATPKPKKSNLLRDVIVPDVAGQMVNWMIDSQLKYSGMRDHTPGSKLGGLPGRESFADGVSACITFREAVSGKYNVAPNRKMQLDPPPTPSAPAGVTTATHSTGKSSDAEGSSARDSGGACDKHLFLSEFSVTQRATAQLGATVADLVVENLGVRMEAETGRKASKAPVWKTKGAKTF